MNPLIHFTRNTYGIQSGFVTPSNSFHCVNFYLHLFNLYWFIFKRKGFLTPSCLAGPPFPKCFPTLHFPVRGCYFPKVFQHCALPRQVAISQRSHGSPKFSQEAFVQLWTSFNWNEKINVWILGLCSYFYIQNKIIIKYKNDLY